MKYFTFQPQFHDAIRSLVKTSTIRPKQKVQVGERFALRHWLGSPYRSKMGWLGTAVCVEVAAIEIVTAETETLPDTEISFGGSLLDDAEADALATQEGFADHEAMIAWFSANHGTTFSGILTRWDPASFVAGAP